MNHATQFNIVKIKKYFDKDYSYKAIIHLMEKKYNLKLSLRTFSRLMSNENLRRKNIIESSVDEIFLAIMIELHGNGFNLGYRSMWKRIRNVYKLQVKQKTVLEFLRIIDQEGIERRCRYRLKRRIYGVPGPNYMWHADGNDKTARWGFRIYGIIDGFSKKVLLLEMASTNKDPKVIGFMFFELIKKMQVLPAILRTDHGTEVVVMEAGQKALRFEHQDKHAGINSFIKGKSTHNQRIESYWRQLRQSMLDFYIILFKLMEERCILDVSNDVHIEILRYCFGNLIQKSLQTTKREWNEHTIRKQSGSHIAGGKPNELYHWPDKYGKKNCAKQVDLGHLDILQNIYSVKPRIYLQETAQFMEHFFTMNTPNSDEEAFDLYVKATSAINYHENKFFEN